MNVITVSQVRMGDASIEVEVGGCFRIDKYEIDWMGSELLQ